MIPIVLSVIIGLFFGKVFFDSYDGKTTTVFSEKDKIYMIQTAVSSSSEKLKESFKDYKKFLCLKEEDGYHLYVGITKSKKIANKIKEFYEGMDYSIYIKEKIIDNKSFLSILGEYDKIVQITTNDDLPEIEKIVMSNYKEMVMVEN